MKHAPHSSYFLKKLLYTITSIIPLYCLTCPVSAEIQPSSKLSFSRYPSYYSSYSTPLTPTPSILLRFNAPVNTDDAAQKIKFISESNSPLKISSKASRPSPEETLKLQPYSKDPNHKQNFPLSHYLLVQPVTQLPTGHTWSLIIANGFTSSDTKTKAATDLTSKLGQLDAFELSSALAANAYDSPRTIQLNFNKELHQDISAETISQYVSVSPEPSALKFHCYHSSIAISGDFKNGNNYKVSISGGLPAADQTFCQQSISRTVVFTPNDPFVHLPAFSTAQNISGAKNISIIVGNTKSTSLRIKKLDDLNLIYALRGYGTYLNNSSNIPFEMVPGRTVFEQTWLQKSALDQSEKIDLTWDSILKTNAPGAYYLCAEGEARMRHSKSVGAQALIQLTDIGLAWKKTKQQTLLYTFSNRSGRAIPGAELTLFDNNADPLLQSKTNELGLVSINLDAHKASNSDQWLEVKSKNDRLVLNVDTDMHTLGLWSFNVPYRYNYDDDDDAGINRRTLIFTDRPVYKPGETVHLKCITRLTDDKQLLPPSSDQATAKLTVFDSQHRTILSRVIAISKHGSMDQEIKLPDDKLGYYQVHIDFNAEGATHQNWRNVFSHSFQVAEYRPNTFEINLETEARYQLPTKADETISIPVSAKYFMGKSLSSAQLRWHANASPSFPHSKDFNTYTFGNANTRSNNSISLSDSLDLSAAGTGIIKLAIPPATKHSLPLQLYLNTEITDINQQTVAASQSLMIHSSDFYLGLLFPSEELRAKKEFTLSAASIGQDGKSYPNKVIADLKIERIIWNTVKVRGAGGTISHRNDSQQIPVMEEKLDIVMSTHSETGTAIPTCTQLLLEESGEYLVTLTAMDASGHPVVASQKINLYGEDDTSNWSRHDGARIDVVPDKESYSAGETAKLLVKSPITGHALVTVEREGVRRTFNREIPKQQSVIEIPIEGADAPNVFVSVLIIRGLKDSPHKHPDTEYRLGYAQLQVDDPSSKLTIRLNTPPGTVEPGQKIDLTAQVTDHLQKPVTGAEVTLYAVDEGVLSLTGYPTPDPESIFNAPFPLSVSTGQSISALLPENPNDIDFSNKGYVIGGGGGGDSNSLTRVRKNFKALAYWNSSLITDVEGKIKASFLAPDNLSEYRIIAVVNHGSRFTSIADKMVIQKPLILEPSLPVFGNVGDLIDLSAILHNNTQKNLDLEVTVELDSTAQFLKLNPAIIPTAAPLGASPNSESKVQTQTIHIAAGETSSLKLPVRFTHIGDAKWTWTARALNDDKLIDRVESNLPVTYPLPLLRHSHRLSLHHKDLAPNRSIDLLEPVAANLFKGAGDIRITFSNSRMIEALDAVDYLLKYPYGCVEQTTSSTLPWLSTQNLHQALPSLNRSPEEISAAIAHGAKRLLSMQTRDGGLAYWPGATDSVLWGSAYGGMALALAEKSGTDLPSQSLDALWKYLSGELRNSGNITEAYPLSQRCLTAYTLALAGHPETGYHDLLFEKRQLLPMEARALLALAMLEANPSENNQSRARQLLVEDENAPNSKVTWYGEPYTTATQLLAWSKLEPDGTRADELAGHLLKLKHGPYVWGSTYSNAWPIFAMARHSLATPPSQAGKPFQIEFNGNKQEGKFDQSLGSLTFHFPFADNHERLPLKVHTTPGTHLYAQSEIATLPELLPFEAVDQGFSIRRNYQRIQNDGSLTAAENLEIGDLILVTLHTIIGDNEHYLAIEDRLPSIFEAINPSFKSQGKQSANHGKWKRLSPHHTEIRKDRVLFFQNYLDKGGEYSIQYLARVIAPGSATAPPAKIEAMYEPQRYGLSDTIRITATSLKGQSKPTAPIAVR